MDSRGEALPKSPLDSNTDGVTIQSHLCLLPDQLGIFIRYAVLLVLTLLILAGRAFKMSLHSGMADPKDRIPLLPISGQSTPALEVENQDASQSNSHSSSSNSADDSHSNGLAVRSNARTRSTSPIKGYGYEPPTPEYEPRGHGYSVSYGDSKPVMKVQYGQAWSYVRSPTQYISGILKPKSRLRTGKKPFFRELVQSILQVATFALLWYAWLAHTV